MNGNNHNNRLSALFSVALAAATSLTATGAIPANAADPSPAAVRAAPVPGSDLMMTDAAFFAALDLSLPELADAKKAAAAGDYAAARRTLAAYYRGRTRVPWKVSPRIAEKDRAAIKWNKAEANDAVAANLYGGLVKLKYQFPNGEIDWHYNATDHVAGQAHNNEWLWQLNRMSWWNTLGTAYAATGDERYAKAWVAQLRSWARQNPPPAKVEHGATSAWRPIETGLRMGHFWPGPFHRFLLSSSFTDDDLVLYLKTCYQHARYLHAFPSGGNHLTMEMNGLYTVGALYPEFKEARTWRQFVSDRMLREIKTQFLPDGAQVELTPPYHYVALDNILAVYNTARITGYAAELPPDYTQGTERAYHYGLYLSTPDRSLPRFNDSWPTNMEKTLATGASLFPQRKDFQWLGTGGREGQIPGHTSHAFDWAGYYAMRSDWTRAANYLAFDAGPLGYAHVHQDKLNLVVYAFGRELLFDSGGGSYEKSAYRDYATDTFSHNCVLVDGKPQRRRVIGNEKERSLDADTVSQKPIDARWQSTLQFDYAQGVYDGGFGAVDRKPATHTRRVLFLKPDLFVVADTLTPNDGASHTYQARWNLLPTQTTLDAATGAVTTTNAGLPNLAVVPLLREGTEVRKASAQTTPELLGWHVRKDMDPQYVPATTVLHTRSGVGVQRFLTLLVPLKAGQSNPVTAIRAAGASKAAVTLSDGKVLQIEDTATGLRVTEMLPGGKPGRQIATDVPSAQTVAR
ncbi:MAG: alginate lyase family protein [Cytophagales bacterium]|nr:alginate lyase family protein [Armatimonadota bacterium]